MSIEYELNSDDAFLLLHPKYGTVFHCHFGSEMVTLTSVDV